MAVVVDRNLLMQWWYYNGENTHTEAELEEFKNIIDKYGVDRVFDVVITSYVCSDGSPGILLHYIRENSVEELFSSIPKYEDLGDEEKRGYHEFKDLLRDVISN